MTGWQKVIALIALLAFAAGALAFDWGDGWAFMAMMIALFGVL